MTTPTQWSQLKAGQQRALLAVLRGAFPGKASGVTASAAEALEAWGLAESKLRVKSVSFGATTQTAHMTRFYKITDAGRALLQTRPEGETP